jgi:hypothetical protein
MAPVLLLVGIALGPVALVGLFIGGFALIWGALFWFVDRAKSHHGRGTQVPPLHP